MNRALRFLCAALLSFALTVSHLAAAQSPQIKVASRKGQLLLNGRPFLILGGELGNSSAETAAAADSILPKLRAMHVNTVLVPVSWEQIEPSEGQFDFSLLDHWLEAARAQDLHLVLLWFGSWKNAFSNYAPDWVKTDSKRFPRAEAAGGKPLEILSTLFEENWRSDARAFRTLMRHIREEDSRQQTVLMVQVENEVGYLGSGRDRSSEANRLFGSPVPDTLVRALRTRRLELAPELRVHFSEHAQNWSEMFGEAAAEVFMAWHYANYVEIVAHAGKEEYALPLYVNAQLPAPAERAGEYPSGGPHPYYLEVWRAAAPSIDFYAPDIYWPNFAYWIDRYRAAENPVFVPEARLEDAPFNAFYAYGQARAFGFSPFSIESLGDHDSVPPLAEVYALLESLGDLLPVAQAEGMTRGLVLHKTSPRPTQTVLLGGYLFEAALLRSWPARELQTNDGAMLVLEASPGEFYVAGAGLSVSFSRDPDLDSGVAGIRSIERVSRADGRWITLTRLNGDQTDQGRRLLMDPHRPQVFRVRLYSVASSQAH